jgi:hypothetical protein
MDQLRWVAVQLQAQLQFLAALRANSSGAVPEPERLSLMQAPRHQLVPLRPLSDAER